MLFIDLFLAIYFNINNHHVNFHYLKIIYFMISYKHVVTFFHTIQTIVIVFYYQTD